MLESGAHNFVYNWRHDTHFGENFKFQEQIYTYIFENDHIYICFLNEQNKNFYPSQLETPTLTHTHT